jgi:hypothetical protein
METQDTDGETSGQGGNRPSLEIVQAADASPSDPPTDEERERRVECEAQIEHGLSSIRDGGREVGDALIAMHDGKLYRWTHSTIESYLGDRWSMSRAQGYRLMQYSQVMAALSPFGDILPATEAAARPLVPLLNEQKALNAAWREATKKHGDRPTAKQVSEVVDKHRKPKATRRKVTPVSAQTSPNDPTDASGQTSVAEPDSEAEQEPPVEKPPVDVVPGVSEILHIFGDLNTPGWPTGTEMAQLLKSGAVAPSPSVRYAVEWICAFAAEFTGVSLNGDTAPVVSIDKPKPTRSGRRRTLALSEGEET